MPSLRYCSECGAEPLRDGDLCRGCWWEKAAKRQARERDQAIGGEQRLKELLARAYNERDEALAALRELVRYQYGGTKDMAGWEAAAAAWAEARRLAVPSPRTEGEADA
jgi:hypothetical protein